MAVPDFIKKFSLLFYILITAIISILVLRREIRNESTWFFGLNFINQYGDDFNIRIFANLGIFLAIFLASHSYGVSFQRIGFLKIVPYRGEQPNFVTVFNRVIQNTLEQGAIFVSILLACLHYNFLDWTPIYFITVVRFFVFGRILFSFGYIVGEIVKISVLRSVGFIITAGSSAILILSVFHVNFLDVLQNAGMTFQL